MTIQNLSKNDIEEILYWAEEKGTGAAVTALGHALWEPLGDYLMDREMKGLKGAGEPMMISVREVVNILHEIQDKVYEQREMYIDKVAKFYMKEYGTDERTARHQAREDAEEIRRFW